ncbi:hypothetical protein CPB83DRAFT_863301, partial [Crepidotus variabilis]
MTSTQHRTAKTPRKQEPLPWVVQCFNGDLIKTSARKIGSEVIANQRSRFRTAIVCSACVKFHANPSHQLLEVLRSTNNVQDSRIPLPSVQNSWPNSNAAAADILLLEYTNIARGLSIDSILLGNLLKEVESNCKWLRWLITVSETSGKWLPKLQDITHAMNEKLSTLMLCYALVDQGFHPQIILTEEVEAAIPTDTNGKPAGDPFTNALIEKIKTAHPKIPIVTGRLSHDATQQSLSVGFATSLATLLCHGLDLPQYYMWNKSNYIVSATPCPVSPSKPVRSKPKSPRASAPNTPKLPTTSPKIREKLTGKSTASPSSSSLRSNISLKPPTPFQAPLRNQLSLPEIKPLRPRRSLPSISAPPSSVPTEPLPPLPIPSVTITNTSSVFQPPRTPKIVLRDSIFFVTITAKPDISSIGFSKGILDVLDKFQVVPESMTTSGRTHPHTCIVVDSNDWTGNVSKMFRELETYGEVIIKYGLSVITVLGDQTSSQIGYDRVVVPLSKAGVQPRMVINVDGVGDQGCSFVISTSDASRAVRALKQV